MSGGSQSRRQARVAGTLDEVATHLAGVPSYRADIQGLRALAVLLVVGYHAGGIIPGGFIGVDAFFVISGYVITGMLLRELRSTGRVDLLRFYLRRARRLLPAAALMIVVTLIVTFLMTSPFDQRAGANAALWATFFAANAYFFAFTNGYFDAAAETNPFLHTWSLAVEEQFYLVVPSIFAVTVWLFRRNQRRLDRALLWVAAGGLGVSLVASVLLSHHALPFRVDQLQFAFYSSPTRAWEFLVGAVLVLRPWPRWLASPPMRWVGAALLLGSSVVLTSTTVFPGLAAIPPVLGTALLIVDHHGVAGPGLLDRLLRSRPAIWIGDRSYSWYLWHWPALALFAPAGNPVRAVIVALASLVAAAAAYTWVEHPLHRTLLRTTPRILVAASLSVALGLSSASAILANRIRMWTNPEVAVAAARIAEPGLYEAQGCTTTRNIGLPQGSRCIFGAASDRPRVLLVGDSHAGMYAEPLRIAAEAAGRQLEVVSFGGCPFVDRPDARSYADPACPGWVKGNLDYFASHPDAYALVVTSSSAAGYVMRDVVRGVYPTVDSATAAWAQDLARTVGAARRPIVHILDVPQVPSYPQCLARRPFAAPEPSCGVLPPDAAQVVERNLVAAAEVQALTPLGAHIIDAATLMCRPDGCSALDSTGMPVLKDSGHMTVAASLSLTDRLTVAVREALAVSP